MDIAFPMKGWDTTHPRNEQPEGTSPDLLNVVPYDRDFRGRGAIRPGLSKYTITQMGNGAQPVLLAQQVTTALDPTTIVPSTLLLNEPFNYANNVQIGSIDSNPADSVADFRGSIGGASLFPFTSSTPNALIIEGASLVANGTVVSGSAAAAAIYLPALSLGAAYIVKADAYINTASSGGVGEALGLYVRLDTGAFAQNGLVFHVYNDKCEIRNANGSVSNAFTFGSALASGFHTIEMHVNGDTITGWVDSVQYTSLTNTLNNTLSGIGVIVGGNKKTSGQGIKNLKVYTGAPLASFRSTSVVTACGGNIYTGDNTGLAIASGGTGVLSTTIKPQMATSKGICYFVDSVHNLKQLTMSTKTVVDITTTAGLETAATLGAYSLACTWRDRLVLAASSASPQNFIMSRQGVQTDFDYSQTDSAAAVAGNASKAGAIGEPLNCLIPWTDDVLILGGDHSIYKVEGDIAAGGQILLLSDSVGTLGPDCWDSDPQGNVYFVGSGGLYQLTPAGLPQNLANDTVKSIFANINRVNTYVVCTWDRDRNGLHIHMTPVNTGSATHIFYDASTGGFFPIQYPDSVGPLTSVVFDGDGPLDRQLLLASRDGYLRKVDPTSLTDDGTNITAYVKIGPFRPAGDAALSVLEGVEVLLGDAPVGFTESDFQVQLSVQTGKDAYTVLTSPERTVSFTFTKQSRLKRLLQRISGGSFVFKFTAVAGKLFSLEKLVVLFTEGGLQRRH